LVHVEAIKKGVFIMERKVDDLGRIVIPLEVRRRIGIQEGDVLEIRDNENEIILKKTTQQCMHSTIKSPPVAK